jgi:hypothetical protein
LEFQGRSGYFFCIPDGSFTLNGIPPGRAFIVIHPPPMPVPAGMIRPQLVPQCELPDIIVEFDHTTFVRATLKKNERPRPGIML